MKIATPCKIISCILKIIVILSAGIGVTISALSSRNAFMGGNTVFMYFTIQSNIAIALICIIGLFFLFRRRNAPGVWYVLKFMGTISITLTGVVFCFILAPAMGGASWNLANLLTHVIVPIASVIDFFVTGIYSHLRMRSVFWVPLPPILYAVYAGIGYVQGWEFAPGLNYPYFFLNWGSPAGAFGFRNELPFMGTAWWIIAIFIALLIVGWIYLMILKGLKKIFLNR